jgi:hypothetical protein
MKYNVGELVVFRFDGVNQVGLITNRRTKKGISTYDIRSEKGSSYLIVPVDAKKSHFYIDSALTSIFRANDGKNNMRVDRALGHTVANYASDITLEDKHYERNNDFVFKTIGARSY